MVYRICFDTASSYYKDPTLPVGDVEYRRELMRESVHRHGPVRFHAAVAYNNETSEYREFHSSDARGLATFLATASELISHSGKLHDLLVLEQVCGAALVAPLWLIPHYDLFEMGNRASLDVLAVRYAPDRLAEWRDERGKRFKQADDRWPKVKLGSSWVRDHEHFVEGHLADARWDVQRTYAVFEALHLT